MHLLMVGYVTMVSPARFSFFFQEYPLLFILSLKTILGDSVAVSSNTLL